MANLFPNTPGVTTEYLDRQLSPSQQDATTRSLLLIGTAGDGPQMQPVRITSLEMADTVFGPVLNTQGYYNSTTLVPGIYEAWQVGNRNLYAMRIGGTPATLTLKGKIGPTGEEQDLIILTSRQAGERYNLNMAMLTYADKTLSLYPAHMNLAPSAYDLNAITTLGALVDSINANSALNDTVASLPESVSRDLKIVLTTPAAADEVQLLEVKGTDTEGAAIPVAFAGGSDGANPDMKEVASLLFGTVDVNGNLQTVGALNLVQDFDVANVVILDAFYQDVLLDEAGNPRGEFGELFANWCADTSATAHDVQGYIGVRPITGDATLLKVSQFVDQLVASPPNFFQLDESGARVLDENGNPIDVGMFVEVVAGPNTVIAHPKLGEFWTPGVTAYAALATTLTPERGTTNKVMPNIRRTRFNFSARQIDRLSGARYVTFRDRLGVGVTVVDGVTAAQPGSDYRQHSTREVARTVAQAVRVVAEPFAGEPNDVPHLNALRTAIQDVLNRFKGHALQDARFEITSNRPIQNLGEAYVDLELWPYAEMHRIHIRVALRANG